MYKPDRWIVIKITNKNETLYKILGGWSGSYLDGQSWRMNSGVSKVESNDSHYLFSGYSGSVYQCHKQSYGTNNIMESIIYKMKQIQTGPDCTVEVLEDQDFTKLLS